VDQLHQAEGRPVWCLSYTVTAIAGSGAKDEADWLRGLEISNWIVRIRSSLRLLLGGLGSEG
jgi:hypothetical protein